MLQKPFLLFFRAASKTHSIQWWLLKSTLTQQKTNTSRKEKNSYIVLRLERAKPRASCLPVGKKGATKGCSGAQPLSQPLPHVEETEKGEKSSDKAKDSVMLPTRVCVLRITVKDISLLLFSMRNFHFNSLCKMFRYQSKIWLGKEVDANTAI